MLDDLLFVVLEFFGEILAELILRPLKGGARAVLESGIFSRQEGDAALSTLALLIAGAATGLLSLFFLPERILQPLVPVGVGVLLATLASGVVMHGLGRWRGRNFRDTTHLETFYGGAVFALAVSSTRLMGVT